MLLAFSFQVVHKQTPQNTDSTGKEWYFKTIFHTGKNTLMLSGHAGSRFAVCPVKNTGAVSLNHILSLVYLNAVHFSAVHLICGALISAWPVLPLITLSCFPPTGSDSVFFLISTSSSPSTIYLTENCKQTGKTVKMAFYHTQTKRGQQRLCHDQM